MRDPFKRPTATPTTVWPYLVEAARHVPGLVDAYRPGAGIDARSREWLIAATAAAQGNRVGVWAHRAWATFIGAERPPDIDPLLVDFATATGRGPGVADATSLAHVLGPDGVRAVRAVLAAHALAGLAANSADGLLARFTRRRPFDPLGAALEAVVVAVAAPLALPGLALAGAMEIVNRLAPPLPEISVPAPGEANLLVHLLAQALPTWLGPSVIRLGVLDLPVPVTIGVRAGRTAASVTIGARQVVVTNGVGPDATIVVEGEVEPLLALATGSVVREASSLRVRRP